MKTSRTEIKAQTVALLVLGHSCREVQRRLRKEFPDAETPHHSTIARWLNKVAGKEAITASAYWSVVYKEAADILLERLDKGEGGQLSFMDAAKFYSIASNVYWNSRERQRQLAGGV